MFTKRLTRVQVLEGLSLGDGQLGAVGGQRSWDGDVSGDAGEQAVVVQSSGSQDGALCDGGDWLVVERNGGSSGSTDGDECQIVNGDVGWALDGDGDGLAGDDGLGVDDVGTDGDFDGGGT